MTTRPLILLFGLLTTQTLAAEVLELSPGHPAIDTSRIEPFEVTFKYKRASNPDPEAGTRVTWRLERIKKENSEYARAYFRTTLITHGENAEYFDINEFDANTLEHIATRIPTQLEDGSLADIDFAINDNLVTGNITPRNNGEIEEIYIGLEKAVMGGGFDLLPATLQLKANMTIRYPKFGFMEKKVLMVEGKVIGQETIQTALGEQLTWKIETRDGNGHHWINHNPPYVYKRLFTINDELSILWELSR